MPDSNIPLSTSNGASFQIKQIKSQLPAPDIPLAETNDASDDESGQDESWIKVKIAEDIENILKYGQKQL